MTGECSVAPFNSILEREKAYRMNENPGPGTYASEQVKVVRTIEDKEQNAFQTRTDRFCPTQPGSGMTKAPTYVENPGPGTHFQSLKFQGHAKSTDAKRALYGSKTHKDLAVVPKPVPSGIPGKKMAPKAYTGLGFDQVGPALYNPKQDAHKQVAPENNFAASKGKRSLWEPVNRAENEYVSREIPGPGKYEPQLPIDKTQQNATGNYSIFMSKVPNCKEQKIKNALLPGPGLYDSKMVKHGDPSSLGSRQGQSTEESSTMS